MKIITEPAKQEVYISSEDLATFARVGQILLERLQETHGKDAVLAHIKGMDRYEDKPFAVGWNKQPGFNFRSFNVQDHVDQLVRYLNNHNPY